MIKVDVVKEGIKYGIIGSVIYLLLTFGAWGMVNTRSFISILSVLNFIPYMIVILIVAGLSLRKKNDNVLSFKDALKFVYVAYIVIAVTEAIGTYALYNWIDPELTAKSFEIGKEMAAKMMKTFGTPEDKMEEKLREMKAEDTGIKKVILGLGISLVWYFCKSLLVALIIRREEKFDD